MADLATTTDVMDRLGRNLTATEALKVDALLVDASASVRSYTHQVISLVVDDVAQVPVRNGKMRLPQRPVISVASVNNAAAAPLYYQWLGNDTIAVGPTGINPFGWEPFRNVVNTVEVVYTHGYDPVPDDIVGIVCQIVLRALGREPTDAAITSESIQGYSYSLGLTGAAGAFGLLQAEKDILDSYTRVGGQIQTAQIWVT